MTVHDADADVLRRRSRRVPAVDQEVRRLVADLVASMRRAAGIGLAAPQIGVSRRVIVADIGTGPVALVNPRVRRRRGRQVGVEGCLSIPGVYGDVERARYIEVDGRSQRGRRIVVKGADLMARVLQHEIDHLNGVLFTDPARLVRRRRLRAARRR